MPTGFDVLSAMECCKTPSHWAKITTVNFTGKETARLVRSAIFANNLIITVEVGFRPIADCQHVMRY